MMSARIGLVIPYFGSPPSWFPYSERPSVGSICTREASRVVRGGIAGLLRLLGRYLGQMTSIRES
jgi:hypothetical protein